MSRADPHLVMVDPYLAAQNHMLLQAQLHQKV
jgi:hypothetical protein